MLSLTHLLNFKQIVIQCHDIPDPDSIGSGYALYIFFKSYHKDVRLIYSGPESISKPNLNLMVKELSIPIEYVTTLEPPELLITVDCRYGEGNVTSFDAHNLCVLDHHITPSPCPYLHDIRSELTSCSTLIWHLLNGVNFNFTDHLNVSTALYYGLLTDSNSFTEISHPLDIEMQNTLLFDQDMIKRLKFSNLSLTDLVTAGNALIRHSCDSHNKFAIFKSEPCDPNILGFISDLAIQVDSFELCIVYFTNDIYAKFSIRSCSGNINASAFARYIFQDIGSGGGHIDKAGGVINLSIFRKIYGNLNLTDFLNNKATEFLLQ